MWRCAELDGFCSLQNGRNQEQEPNEWVKSCLQGFDSQHMKVRDHVEMLTGALVWQESGWRYWSDPNVIHLVMWVHSDKNDDVWRTDHNNPWPPASGTTHLWLSGLIMMIWKHLKTCEADGPELKAWSDIRRGYGRQTYNHVSLRLHVVFDTYDNSDLKVNTSDVLREKPQHLLRKCQILWCTEGLEQFSKRKWLDDLCRTEFGVGWSKTERDEFYRLRKTDVFAEAALL